MITESIYGKEARKLRLNLLDQNLRNKITLTPIGFAKAISLLNEEFSLLDVNGDPPSVTLVEISERLALAGVSRSSELEPNQEVANNMSALMERTLNGIVTNGHIYSFEQVRIDLEVENTKRNFCEIIRLATPQK